MQLLDDGKLLSEYATRQSEDAFATLVARHVNLVYSAALRQAPTHNWPRKSRKPCSSSWPARREPQARTVLPGWLYRTTRFAAGNALKPNPAANSANRRLIIPWRIIR